jgi:uncharacterized membrane protein YcaP (DUF421 family)
MDIPIPDITMIAQLARSLVVSVLLLVALRVAGTRQLGQRTAFDLVVLLIISAVLQNAAIANHRSLGGGLLGAFVIVALNWLVAWLTFRHTQLQRMVLVRPGHVLDGNLDCEHTSMAELRTTLRKKGIATMSEVRDAILEDDGRASVIPWSVLPA